MTIAAGVARAQPGRVAHPPSRGVRRRGDARSPYRSYREGMDENNGSARQRKHGMSLGAAIAIGIGVGAAIGVSGDNLALGVGMGVLIGVITFLVIGRRRDR